MLRPAFPRLVQMQEHVKSLFYRYGLLCATHQLSMMVFAIVSTLFVVYPLKDIPFLGNAPQVYEMPVNKYIPPVNGIKIHGSPGWYNGVPVGYVQQILVKTTIAPWDRNSLKMTDSYRSPLLNLFSILELINNYQYVNGSEKVNIGDVCMRVSEPDPDIIERDLLPQYDCLILSPGNLWKNQLDVFKADKEVIKTIYAAGRRSYDVAPKLRELLFGVRWLDTGLNKYTIRNRQRTVQYAITIIYKVYHREFIESLTKRLQELYPLSTANQLSRSVITNVSYRENSTSYLVEYTPLIAAYLLLFLYIFFSVQKIEMVKSKWGLALAAVVTVVMSLLMSISICAVFGVTPSVNSGEIFPYLVVIIGLENVLVLTRSVVSTPLNLEVKFRIAEGLKKEGWNITKNLLTELIILVLGFLTFVPAIQEFCLFASIGLLVDFYLQMVFFATVLSIDIRRLELSDLDRHTYLHVQSQSTGVISNDRSQSGEGHVDPVRQTSSLQHAARRTDERFVVASLFRIPRRIKVMNFVAQFRIVQRLIMFCTVIWIGVVLYKTGIIAGVVSSFNVTDDNPKPIFNFKINDTKLSDEVKIILNDVNLQSSAANVLYQDPAMVDSWKSLSFMHWPAVFSLYNKSIVGTYVSFLPTIKLSILIPADQVLSHSLIQEDLNQMQESSDDGEPAEMTDQSDNSNSIISLISRNIQLSAFSTTEKVLIGLGTLAVLLLLIWLLVVLYSVMCRKDYAKWRKKAGRNSLAERMTKYAEMLKDESSFYMRGLSQSIECLVCSADLIVSSDLAGDIRVWNAVNGETISTIERTILPVQNMNFDDDYKMLQQHNSVSQSYHDHSTCSQSAATSDVLHFDFAPFVETQFFKMEKKSFSDCLKRIEQERTNQAAMMSSISATYEQSMLRRRGNRGHSSTSSNRLLDGATEVHSMEIPTYSDDTYVPPPNIWCLDVFDGLIVAGCSDGSIEFWDSSNGSLKYQHKNSRSSGIASIKFVGNRVVTGRSDGYLDFTEICYVPKTGGAQQAPAALQTKGHRRIRSMGRNNVSWRDNDIQCNSLQSFKAHQSAIGLLATACGRCLTACEDKVINVYRLDDANLLYNLRGHQESIILLQADDQTATAQTASEDGIIRLWDLLTGACIHKLSGLIGPVLNLQISTNYIAASSLQSLICVWDKSSGRMLHSIHETNTSYTGAITILADMLLISGGKDRLYFWDLESGELVYTITLPSSSALEGVNRLSIINNSTLVATVGANIHSIVFPRLMLSHRI